MGAIVVSMLLWGVSWPSGKILTRYCSVINFTVYRYIVVVATMTILLVATRTSFRIRKAGIPLFMASGVLLGVYSYFFFMGLKNGSAGAGGVLVTTLNPIMAYTIGILLSRKLPSRNEGAGLVLGLVAGCILLKLWDTSVHLLDSGNLYFLLASLCWAFLSKFTSRGGQHGASMAFSLWQYVVTLACLLPLANMPEMLAALHIQDSTFWLNLFFSSAIVTSLATTLYFYSTTKLGAEKASSFIFMVPLAAAMSSWIMLDEHIKPHTVAGGLLGMVAVYLNNKRKTT